MGTNYRENQRRLTHQYKVNDKVLLEKPGIIPKMSQPRNGPYKVIEVFTNGTNMIRKGAVTH